MANIISRYSEGEIEFSIYSKDDLKSRLGVKRTVYDIIHEGDIKESIFWIIKVRSNDEENNAKVIAQFLEENKDEIIFGNPGGLMKNNLTWLKEYNILKDAHFIDVRFGAKIDGFMSTNMVYENEKSQDLLDKLKSKRLVVS